VGKVEDLRLQRSGPAPDGHLSNSVAPSPQSPGLCALALGRPPPEAPADAYLRTRQAVPLSHFSSPWIPLAFSPPT
jgi:hypothetical protein